MHKSIVFLIKNLKLIYSTVSTAFVAYYFYMNMANKSQMGLFPEASQDMTGNWNDSEQKLHLLKI